MKNMQIDEVIKAVNGTPINIRDNFMVSGVSTDTRKIHPGNVFVALVGNTFNGNKFVDKAFQAGAKAAIVSEVSEGSFPQILVNNTGDALKALASHYRNKFDIPMIAVTGSTGKTSTKEMIASVLSQKCNVHKTQQNFNNEIGLPLTLFELEDYHDISVLEMGMNNLKEIQRLVEIARPHIGVITNIGTAHIENLGSRDNIFKAKMEITTFFNEKDILIVNGDDDYLGAIKNTPFKVIRVSMKGEGDFNAFDIVNRGEEGIEFKCKYRGVEEGFETAAPGIHNVYNALVAIALGEIYNLEVDSVKKGIRDFSPGKLRMEIISLDDMKIINDCYNANLDSMKAALEVLSGYKSSRRIAVLGDMFELGSFSEEAHRTVGAYLKGRCDIFVTVGKDSKYIYDEAINELKGYHFETKDDACRALIDIVKAGDVILVKASRGMKMEEITKMLIQDRKRGF